MQNFSTRPWRSFVIKIGVFLLACLLASCSALRVGYSNGESVVYWWLDGYVDFQGDQKAWARNHIHNLFAWHRTTQLKDYAQLFAQAQQQLQHSRQHPITQDDVLADYAAIKQRAFLVIDKSLPQLADLALALQPQQIAHLEKKFASNNEGYRRDYLSGDLEYRQHFRFKRIMRQAEYWFGDFNSQQEAQIRAASNARPLNNEIWMAERLRHQQELIGILKKIRAEKPGREAAAAMLKKHAAAAFDLITYNENKAFFDALRDGNAQLVALIVNIATPAQKTHAVKRLQNLIDDCNTMAVR